MKYTSIPQSTMQLLKKKKKKKDDFYELIWNDFPDMWLSDKINL